jgi:hypothetical protein
MDFWKNKKSQNPNKSMLANNNLKANKVKEKIDNNELKYAKSNLWHKPTSVF